MTGEKQISGGLRKETDERKPERPFDVKASEPHVRFNQIRSG